ncbi:MAG TPA: multidrug ABC transporter ATPase [Lacisediminihabitans sp.]|nr:multidrug ABC transporter ATPase [Lacisediminihabitans sp.]HXD60912.1 multidrug ABC transporter ATPase [Lacisediminihabitans sp.]
MAQETPATIHRNERVIAYMIVAIVGLSIVAFFAVIVGTFNGMTGPDFAQGIWPAVAYAPLIGLPIGFLLIIVLLVLGARRRGREAANANVKR